MADSRRYKTFWSMALSVVCILGGNDGNGKNRLLFCPRVDLKGAFRCQNGPTGVRSLYHCPWTPNNRATMRTGGEHEPHETRFWFGYGAGDNLGPGSVLHRKEQPALFPAFHLKERFPIRLRGISQEHVRSVWGKGNHDEALLIAMKSNQ